MRKAGIVIASVFGTLLLAAWIIPTFFKDQLIERLGREINSRVKAQVNFRPERVSVSLFRHFPNLTITTDSLSIVGVAPFVGDTLLSTPSLEATVNLWSVWRGDKIDLQGLYLKQPRVLVKRLRDGQANYDIYNPPTSTAEADTANANVVVHIREWEITDGQLHYHDQGLPMDVWLSGVTHRGQGDLSAEVSEMLLETEADRLTLRYNGVDYLTDKKLTADMRLRADLPRSEYTFTDNHFRLNDLPIDLNGVVALPDTSIRFDLTYRTPDSDFKNLLSLVPGIYSERFNEVEADGRARFDGTVKGLYNARQFPAFTLNTVVQQGRFKYPNLPQAVENINLDLRVSNSTDRFDNTVLDLKALSATIGRNPVRGSVRVQGLTNTVVNANVSAKLNLEEFTKVFPIDSLTLRGLYDLNVVAKGTYNKAARRFPVVNARMKLANGYVRSLKFPEPLEQVNAIATVTNRTGNLADTRIDIGDLRLALAGEPFRAKGFVQNLDDYTYDIAAQGKLDLTKMARIFDLKSMKLSGIIDADIQTSGRVSDAKAGRYEKLPATGTLLMTNVTYRGDALPQGITLTKARMDLKPGQLTVPQMQGLLGTSAFSATGSLSNYMPFLLQDDQPLRGTMTVEADRFDLNEWMIEEPNEKVTSQSHSVIAVPANIDFTLTTNVSKALYDNMQMNNISGAVRVADRAVTLDKMSFDALGGRIVTNGTYDTKDLLKPLFNFDLNIENAQTQQAFQHLSVVKNLMPLAQYLIGNFTSTFRLRGVLGQDMMPQLNTLTGAGLVKLVEATLQQNPVLEEIIRKTRLREFRESKFRDVLLQTEIINGAVAIRPFTININDYKANIGGNASLDGGLDYILKLDVPTGRAGADFSKAFAQLTGKPLVGVDRAKIDLSLKGRFRAPEIRLIGSSTADQIKQTVVQQVLQPVEDAKQRALARADSLRRETETQARARVDSLRAAADRAKAEAEARLKVAADSVRAEADRRRREAEQKAKERLKQEGRKVLDNLLKPKTKPAEPVALPDSTKQ